ncbi:unnamed protein product, partial [Phaeothamnion confervicola]
MVLISERQQLRMCLEITPLYPTTDDTLVEGAVVVAVADNRPKDDKHDVQEKPKPVRKKTKGKAVRAEGTGRGIKLKGCRNAFLYYMSHRRKELAAAIRAGSQDAAVLDLNCTHQQFSSKTAVAWRLLPAAVRRPFEAMAEADKVRYQQERVMAALTGRQEVISAFQGCDGGGREIADGAAMPFGAWMGSHDEYCYVCFAGGKLLCCDFCSVAVHGKCLLPPRPRAPAGRWLCPQCVVDAGAEAPPNVWAADAAVHVAAVADPAGAADAGAAAAGRVVASGAAAVAVAAALNPAAAATHAAVGTRAAGALVAAPSADAGATGPAKSLMSAVRQSEAAAQRKACAATATPQATTAVPAPKLSRAPPPGAVSRTLLSRVSPPPATTALKAAPRAAPKATTVATAAAAANAKATTAAAPWREFELEAGSSRLKRDQDGVVENVVAARGEEPTATIGRPESKAAPPIPPGDKGRSAGIGNAQCREKPAGTAGLSAGGDRPAAQDGVAFPAAVGGASTPKRKAEVNDPRDGGSNLNAGRRQRV